MPLVYKLRLSVIILGNPPTAVLPRLRCARATVERRRKAAFHLNCWAILSTIYPNCVVGNSAVSLVSAAQRRIETVTPL